MAHDIDRFRAEYRAGIHGMYSPWLHGAFVFGFGAAGFVWFVSRVSGVRPLEWLSVPAALLFFNWGEYAVHRSFGHRKTRLGGLFYRRHTVDHHGFFVSSRMRYEEPRDFRVILFPAWLIVVYVMFLALPVYVILGFWRGNVGALCASTLLAGYLSYEFFHTCHHLPDEHPLSRLPGVREMRQHHRLHHDPGVMLEKNFNLVFPLMDVLHGTFRREPRPE